VLATEDGLGMSPNGVAVAKMLEPCVGVVHVEADIEENTPQPPYLARQMSMDFVSQEHGVPHDGPNDSNAGGCTREILDRNETRRRKPRDAGKHNALQRGRHQALPRFRALVVR
jgi:hypothetical protein